MNQFLVSEGNSIGRYSNHLLVSFKTLEEARRQGNDSFPEGFTIWHYEWDEDRNENIPVLDE